MSKFRNTNTNWLNKIKRELNKDDFDLEFESDMVQSRILSPILEIIEEKGLSQEDLSELTGLSQSFLSSVFNNSKNLNMKHIALLQRALNIVIQPPLVLSKDEHTNKFYSNDSETTEIDFKFQIIFNDLNYEGFDNVKKIVDKSYEKLEPNECLSY